MIIEVSISGETPRRYRLHRDGEQIVVDHLEGTNVGKGTNNVTRKTLIDCYCPQTGIYSLLIGKASYEVFIGEAPDHLDVHLKSQTYRVQAADIRRHRAVTDGPVTVDGLVRITAPIPGRVSRILVQPGQQIGRGDGIVVVEAMKMENELRAPGDGTVVAVAVEEGQAVEGGALLATIE